MEKVITTKNIAITFSVVVIAALFILFFKACNTPSPSPAVEQLQNINDSLYDAIKKNNVIAGNLYARIDSITMLSDTIVQRQNITNKYYTNEVYNILNADDAAANKQLRTTLKKSDSLLKSGFYSKTYDLRPATNELKFH